jgi:hypothetical protein
MSSAMDDKDRSRGHYRIDLSASKFEALAEELERHRPRDRGRRLAELAALGLKAELDGLIPAAAIKAMGMVAAAPSPALPPAVTIGGPGPVAPAPPVPIAKPAKTPAKSKEAAEKGEAAQTGGSLPPGDQLESIEGWARDLGFPIE